MWAATYTWYMTVNHNGNYLDPIWLGFDIDELDWHFYSPQIYCTLNLQRL